VTILVGNPPQAIRIPFNLFVDEQQAKITPCLVAQM
jgi:hypothetical protein